MRERITAAKDRRAAATALVFCNDKLLLQSRYSSRYFFLPGGRIHYRESPLEALHRELYEDMGFVFEDAFFVLFDYRMSENRDKDMWHFLFCISCKVFPKFSLDLREVDQFHWVARSDALSLVEPYTSVRLARAFELLDKRGTDLGYCEQGTALA
jgi:8-oxo-dGTP pyrophosphatase MutT (NUDIX family)